jgi:hypothetical protein
MDAICSSVAPIREGSKTDWHRRRVLAHLVQLAIFWALLTRIRSLVGFRAISKGKHNTAHLERELELAVGDGSKAENRDGSKVNWDNLHGKMSEDVGPYKIERFFKDPEF